MTEPERDRFVLPAGRGASLRTRMDCIPDRDDPARYTACVARGGLRYDAIGGDWTPEESMLRSWRT